MDQISTRKRKFITKKEWKIEFESLTRVYYYIKQQIVSQLISYEFITFGGVKAFQSIF